jgi:hypothetical protein
MIIALWVWLIGSQSNVRYTTLEIEGLTDKPSNVSWFLRVTPADFISLHSVIVSAAAKTDKTWLRIGSYLSEATMREVRGGA